MSLWRLRQNCMWLRLEGALPSGPVFLGLVYLPPGASNPYLDPDALELLDQDVSEASALGTVILSGDFNARTGTAPDVDPCSVDPSLLDDRSADPRTLALAPRASPDRVLDARGKALLEFCRAASLVIANGRLPGNSGTTPTSRGIKDIGTSVVDYFLVPPAVLPVFERLEVTPLDRAVSDHNLLTLSWPLPAAPAPPAPGLTTARPQFSLPRSDIAVARFELALSVGLGYTTSVAPVDLECSTLQSALTTALSAVTRRQCQPRPAAAASLPWYTPALARLNAAVRRCAVKVRSLPVTHPAYGPARAALCAARLEYRTARRRAESHWRDASAASFAGLAASNPRRFWRSIFDSEVVAPQATAEALTRYFEDLLNPTTALVDVESVAPLGSGPAPTDTAALTRLVDPFTASEVTETVQTLKTGRTADIFGLKAEVIRFLLPYVSSHLTPLLNRFFSEGFPPSLSTSVLIPIYKGKGSPSDPSNFRGISITPILSKLYACLLERRLSAALDTARLRADSQFGFRRRRGTREAAFALRAVCEAQPRQRPVYCAFVDFQKAFDSVQRPLLWRLLRNLSVPEPFVRAIESYYERVEFQVETPAGLGRPCTAGVGVRQGCPLSPVLFGIFIEAVLRAHQEDLTDFDPPRLGRSSSGPLQPFVIPPLLYADDLTLLSLSPEGLQRQLDRLQVVASSFGLAINVAKTKLLAVGPSAPPPDRLPAVTLAGQALEWVEEFRYLGLLIHFRKGFARAPKALHAAALSKYHAMVRQCRAKGVEDVQSLNVLFDSLVTSVLGYGAPLWAPDIFCPNLKAPSLPVDDPPAGSTALDYERLQRRFMRLLLGLPQRTPHIALHVESRRPPLALLFYKHTMRFLERLRDPAVFPPDSLIAHALAASADYQSSSGSWLKLVAQWSARLGPTSEATTPAPTKFDPASCIAPALQPLFSATAAMQSRTRAGAATLKPMPPTPAAKAVPLALQAWGKQLVDQATRQQFSFSHLIDAAVQTPSWSRRPPLFYSSYPRIPDRSHLALSRLCLPLGSRSMFTSPSSDLRSLDPDPIVSADLVTLAQAHYLNPSVQLSVLLSDPPKTWLPFVRKVLRYFILHDNHVSRRDLLRLLPQLSQ